MSHVVLTHPVILGISGNAGAQLAVLKGLSSTCSKLLGFPRLVVRRWLKPSGFQKNIYFFGGG